ncbi:hypothetical protein BGZ51_001766 [Haplosporangium sp. Z 767]|nr:hypothetical protein BGZ51_001766 [Haplosporangium sp. Z 767]
MVKLTAEQPKKIKENIHRAIVEYFSVTASKLEKKLKSGCVYFLYKNGPIEGTVSIKIGNTKKLLERLMGHNAECGISLSSVLFITVPDFVELLERIIQELLTAHQVDYRCMQCSKTHVEMFTFALLEGESEESGFRALMDIMGPWIINWAQALEEIRPFVRLH